MLTRRWMATAIAALALVGAGGAARAAERSMMGIVLGRWYRQVLAKFGNPNQIRVVNIPVPGQQPGAYDPNNPGAPGGAPGYGAPGYGGAGGETGGGAPGYGGPPGYSGGNTGGPSYGPPGGGSTGGGPPGYGGPPGGGSTGGGPPMLPPAGGAPGGPGYGPGGGGYGDPNSQGMTITGIGNAAEWIYKRPGGTTLAFIINEDSRVAQISVSSSGKFAPARTARGITLGDDFKKVMIKYGYPTSQLVTNWYHESYYPKNHHAAFTFIKDKLVRITIALAD